MDLLSFVSSFGGLAWTIAAFLVVLGVVVFVHEYGHYIVARWCGIHSEVFSVGFGKELYGWIDKRGTRWRIAALPLGGYVKFYGDNDAASARTDTDAVAAMSSTDRARSFPGAPVWKRALTVAAGPAANFLLSIVIFAAMALALGLPSDRPVIGEIAEEARAELPFQPGDEVLSVDGREVAAFGDLMDVFDEAAAERPGAETFEVVVRRDGSVETLSSGPLVPPVIGAVIENSAAAEAGLEDGDRVLSIGGTKTGSYHDLVNTIRDLGAVPMEIVVERGGETLTLQAEPRVTTTQDAEGAVVNRPLLGVRATLGVGPEITSPGPVAALGHGVARTWQVISSTLAYVAAMITGQADSSALGGPIKIASLSGDAAGQGVATFLGMIALISTSIGLINLFPIPVLDGGHLVFYAVEAVRGRPVGDRVIEMATGVGLGLVILLMVFVTYNDIAGL